MNPNRFFMPSYMGMRNIPMIGSSMGMANSVSRNMGLFSRITNGIRSVNWGGLLNNANKTLNVVNQAIPLVRQAGPMVNNMKSMLRIAKAFGSETTVNRNNSVNNKIVNLNTSNISSENLISTENSSLKKETQYSSVPNFFI